MGTRVLNSWPQTSRMRIENFVAFVLILSLVAIATSSHATSPTSIVVPRSPVSPTATTSSTEASEFKDPRTPTFFESQFFTGIRFWVKWSTKLVPKVFKHIPFPGAKPTYKIDIVEELNLDVKINLYPAPHKTVTSKDFRVGQKKMHQRHLRITGLEELARMLKEEKSRHRGQHRS